MSKVLAHPVSMTDAEIDEISAVLIGNGIACAEVGRGGFLPILGEDEEAEMILGRSDEDATA